MSKLDSLVTLETKKVFFRLISFTVYLVFLAFPLALQSWTADYLYYLESGGEQLVTRLLKMLTNDVKSK